MVDAALKQDRIVESLDTEIIGLVPAGSVPTRVRPVQDIVGHQKERLAAKHVKRIALSS